MGWSPDSWRGLEARQQPDYPDPAALAAATRELAAYPPLVDATDVETLRAAVAEAQAGRAFLLQGGDCAESFAEFAPETIRANHALMGAMAATIGNGTGVSVVRIGRIAGQFAKPRSEPLEKRDGIALPAWRGDIVNGIAFNATARRPDPERMFRAYGQAAATLAHLGRLSGDSRFFTAHEMLLLRFEEALVRRQDDKFYASSAHFLWIGDRTRFAGSAHVEFARGIANPIGIKCGPTLQPDELLRLLDLHQQARPAGLERQAAEIQHSAHFALQVGEFDRGEAHRVRRGLAADEAPLAGSAHELDLASSALACDAKVSTRNAIASMRRSTLGTAAMGIVWGTNCAANGVIKMASSTPSAPLTAATSALSVSRCLTMR